MQLSTAWPASPQPDAYSWHVQSVVVAQHTHGSGSVGPPVLQPPMLSSAPAGGVKIPHEQMPVLDQHCQGPIA
jgi:hypothetical protein